MDKFTRDSILIGLCIIVISIICFFWINLAFSQSINDIALCNAIFKAEGGYQATYLYGIRSVHYEDEQEARQICLNTIRNNKRRYREYGYKKYNTYLEFLASRYAPINAENDPKQLNKNWLKNVTYFYNEEIQCQS